MTHGHRDHPGVRRRGGRPVPAPAAIPYYPLPAIVACLILDGVDQTIFQAFGHDPPNYQSYDKAMDVFYLSMAYLSTLRNWESMPAFRIGWFLYFYRLVGALAFELTHARWLLLVFPNVFEYFFIAYETIRSRWQPVQLLVGWWLSAAALIWVVVKLPQEYWLHVAQLDVTDRSAATAGSSGCSSSCARPGAGLPEAGAAAAVAAGLVVEVPARATPRGDRRARGAGGLADAVRRDPLHRHPREGHAVGLVAVIFSQMLPDFTGSTTDVFIGVAAVVVVNSGITLAAARRRGPSGRRHSPSPPGWR